MLFNLYEKKSIAEGRKGRLWGKERKSKKGGNEEYRGRKGRVQGEERKSRG